MGASDIPYLYQPTANRQVAYPYSDFNPKAVTEASYQRLSQTTLSSQAKKEKNDGPLINFNRHPDSYMFVAEGGRTIDHKPMPANTKRSVVSLRWVQFALRLVQEIVALGLLVATICFNNTSGVEMYLIRIPQACDAFMTLYAIYHLMRPAKARTAGNQASYHIFALILDTALIPLYIYVVLATHANYLLPPNKVDAAGEQVGARWTSVFGNPADTDLLMTVTWLGAAIVAALHLISCAFDLALIILFQKIHNLPPDMNPLEDNLTSRKTTSKHKHKSSELTSDPCLSDAEKKRMAYLSGSTLDDSDSRMSRTSLAKPMGTTDGRSTIPFSHSRNDSSQSYSPHNPETARWSRHQFEGQQAVYQEACTTPRSRYQVRPDGKLEVRSRRGSASPSKRDTMTDAFTLDVTAPAPDRKRPRSPPLSSYLASMRTASPAMPNAAESNALVKAQQKEALLNDNWYVLDDDNASGMGVPSRRHTPAPTHGDSVEPTATLDSHPKPLGTNPPTPPMPESEHDDDAYETVGVGRTLTATSNITASSSIYSESAPSLKFNSVAGGRPGTPKGKYYGDLAAATRRIRKDPSPPTAALGPYGMPSPQASRSPSPEKKARVVSRTGADITDPASAVVYAGVESGKFGGVRSRRDVSGKVAEEGRGGVEWQRPGRSGGRKLGRGEWVD